MSSGPPATLDRRARLSLALQRGVAYAVSPLTVLAVVVTLRGVLGYRIEGLPPGGYVVAAAALSDDGWIGSQRSGVELL